MKHLRVSRRHILQGAGAMGILGALGQPMEVFADNEEGTRVRWDLIHLNTATTPPTLNPGGVASADAEAMMTIRLTGTGTFVAPTNGEPSRAVTGGGTWETFEHGMSSGNGTYWVTGLASWQFANMQTATFIDNIGNNNARANGNAVLRIAYSDGSQGTLGIGCMGPGAPMGIQEGVIATKGYKTYWSRETPVDGVDANRTIFHILSADHRGDEGD
ncbi:MAG: hypothetical protein NVSMB65_09610 [Chloroflexota bacterium]